MGIVISKVRIAWELNEY